MREEYYKLYQHKSQRHYFLKLCYDQSPESPRTWDNLGHCEFFHRNYNYGDENKFLLPSDAKEYALSKKVISLPVYLYDHSGCTINTTGFTCRWDSGQLGYIWVTVEDALKAFEWKKLTGRRREQVQASLKAEIEVLDQYITGDVFGFELVNTETGEEDSCWDFFGSKLKDNGIMEHIPEGLDSVEDWVEVEEMPEPVH